jgi:hypothetical protein
MLNSAEGMTSCKIFESEYFIPIHYKDDTDKAIPEKSYAAHY